RACWSSLGTLKPRPWLSRIPELLVAVAISGEFASKCVGIQRFDSNRYGQARGWRAMRPVWPRPAFTLIPISPARLTEKQQRNDHFFYTVMKEGVLLAAEN